MNLRIKLAKTVNGYTETSLLSSGLSTIKRLRKTSIGAVLLWIRIRHQEFPGDEDTGGDRCCEAPYCCRGFTTTETPFRAFDGGSWTTKRPESTRPHQFYETNKRQ
ncbi:Hypothetical protein FKW44_016157 [Caligus rogercresseyi]|uniref:Uncharacterized protein n=1 Tax=Caligus rogercresseyi TaxID=217165 RepID=A0A7T8H1A9_CALRO|nr:Hypothetical protein FKW44_016157 [Caligus rogercresseyi]